MRNALMILTLSALTLSGCATVRDSRLNPFNWFGRSAPVAVPGPEGEVNTLIPRRSSVFRSGPEIYPGRPVAEVSDVTIERVPGGAILRATGIAARQGAHDVRLIPDETSGEDGALSYRMEAVLPARRTPVGTEAARRVVVAEKLTDGDLFGVRQIRVMGASNARAIRR